MPPPEDAALEGTAPSGAQPQSGGSAWWEWLSAVNRALASLPGSPPRELQGLVLTLLQAEEAHAERQFQDPDPPPTPRTEVERLDDLAQQAMLQPPVLPIEGSTPQDSAYLSELLALQTSEAYEDMASAAFDLINWEERQHDPLSDARTGFFLLLSEDEVLEVISKEGHEPRFLRQMDLGEG